MKNTKIGGKIAGVILFILSLFFSIVLLIQVFGFESVTDNTVGLLSFGKMIVSSYGISSILIPLYFLVAAFVCLSNGFSFRNRVQLTVGLVPFFTSVGIEKYYQAYLSEGQGPVQVMKIVFTITIILMLMAIEFLLAEVIAKRLIEKKQTKTVSTPKESEAEVYVNSEPLVEEEVYETNEIEQTSEVQEETVNEQKASDFEYLPPEEYLDAYETIKNKSIESLEKEYEESTVDEADIDDSFEERIFEPETVQETKLEEEPKILQEKEVEVVEPEVSEEKITEVIETEAIQEEASEEDSEKLNTVIDDEYDENQKHTFDSIEPVNVGSYSLSDRTEINSDEINEDVENEEDVPQNVDGLNSNDVFAQMEADIRQSLMNEDEVIESENDIEEKDLNDDLLDESEIDDNDLEQDELDTEILEPVVETREQPKLKRSSYKIPTDGVLSEYEDQKYWIIDEETNEDSARLKETLNEFNIEAEVTGIRKGPVVTMFEILPAPGVKLSKIVALQDNIALSLAASSVRIVAPIPGKQAVGIEVPNKDRAIVSFRELIEQENPAFKKMQVPVILGKDIQGESQITDLVKTPHLLIAGATGSGKSVCVNSIILSILYKRSPQQVKLILIDPKIVELKLYNDIPHLLTPVITESKKAFQSLQYCLCEMERRYALLDGMGVRDIVSYNNRIEQRKIAAEKLPYIVVIIDEFADLMATTGKELESTVARLAAMSRAVGIHLVLATQRPSIDVITGLIKANIPSRIAFMVASKMDSRIIIDQVGAEKLLGRGDMLYSSAADPFPVRIQGTFVSDNEVENVVEYVKQYGPPEYIDDEIFVEEGDDEGAEPNLFGDGDDPLYNKALEIIVEAGKASASYIQRRLKIGYNRAARLVEEMEARGIVGPANGSKPREIIHIP